MTAAPGSGDALEPGGPVAGLLRCTPATPGATATTIVSALFRSACPAGDPRLAPSSPSASNDLRPALGVSGDLHHPVPDSTSTHTRRRAIQVPTPPRLSNVSSLPAADMP